MGFWRENGKSAQVRRGRAKKKRERKQSLDGRKSADVQRKRGKQLQQQQAEGAPSARPVSPSQSQKRELNAQPTSARAKKRTAGRRSNQLSSLQSTGHAGKSWLALVSLDVVVVVNLLISIIRTYRYPFVRLRFAFRSSLSPFSCSKWFLTRKSSPSSRLPAVLVRFAHTPTRFTLQHTPLATSLS